MRLRYLCALILIAACLFVGLWFDYRQSVDGALPLNQVRYFEILKGEGLQAIGGRLAAEGIFLSPRWFALAVQWRGVAGRLKYGEYELRPGMNALDLVDLFASGKVYLHAVTFVEGWNFRQCLQALKANPALAQTIGETDVMERLGSGGSHPEGQFFPDTYRFPKGIPETVVLSQARDRMTQVLESEWQGRSEGLPLLDPYEALILASIVEKESALPEERVRIAGVFLRRLQSGMKLQTDPTVIYGLGAAFDGNLRRSDLEQDTPYNTYVHAGLPPTPIAMPGRDAIHAVLHPAAEQSLYFVAKGDGSHVFSATLEEHRQAVDIYQKHKATP